MSHKRKISISGPEEEVLDSSDYLNFICLGGGNEVGRSCHIIQYKGKTVMLDAGAHPAYDGLQSLPYYDDFDLSTVDILLISHFHMDHAASLPYVMTQTTFKGRVFMTHATKAIYKWLIQDSVRLGNTHADAGDQLFSEADHLAAFERIEAIDYHTTISINGIRITPYHAGHVLGACMYFLEIAGLKILFTGDYSREDDRHLISAEIPPEKPDVLICESTYGDAIHMPRMEKEGLLMRTVTDILNRGGRVLMPVFALGRAQELLLILDEYWERHSEYQGYPIYYASNLARKCMVVYQTYVNTMNDNIKRILYGGSTGKDGEEGTVDVSKGRNPWDFKFIRALKSLERFEDVGGCVMLASPGMLQSGVSRELLERWAPDPKNGVIVTGYSVEGTMAKQLMHEPLEIPAVMTGRAGGKKGDDAMIPRRCLVKEISFAAHVDSEQNIGFIEKVGAGVVILVHGEQNNMGKLKSKLLSRNHDKKEKLKIYNPRNCQELKIPFKSEKLVKVVGKLARKHNQASIKSELDASTMSDKVQLMNGVIVQSDFKLSIMAPEDLREYAGLTTTVVTCKQRVQMTVAGVQLVKWSLENMFGSITEIKDTNGEDSDQEIKPEDDADDEEESEDDSEGYKTPTLDSDDDMGEKKKRVKKEKKKRTRDLVVAEKEPGMKISLKKKEEEKPTVFRVMDCITVNVYKSYVELVWEGNMLNDGIADAVLAILLGIESSPAAVKYSSKFHSHTHTAPPPHAVPTPSERLERVLAFLEAQFGQDHITLLPKPEDPEEAKALERELGVLVPGVEINIDGNIAKVMFRGLEVEAKQESMKMRVRSVVERAVETVATYVAA
ncbi:Metallo-hydrolase/oxidoreductase [Ascobolus immersus RN42]|uniref:Metallo-hydrolase/oxidoreductase n=1 Tax=Ascobolus immersus RN42 TaxID=1160509 RepID=A0A3N4IFY1_ASCIM|nr:Metallo-hydrolase/oxidoreductase [Ascobolus immersus RN42]